ncbi:DUF1906 domain-containing protein [bacterium LRH843]|nr:DUF1906 domain-containing protein [bacterium LRH843]
MAIYNWGVDSAARVTEELYNCVEKNFGKPDFWGRYLSDVSNVSDGLTTSEVPFIRDKGMKLLPIFNKFNSAIGAREGSVAARNAIFKARSLGVNEGSFIFAKVEHFFDVEADWISAWVDTMVDSPYQPGFYADVDKGLFNDEYCKAAASSKQVREQAVIWSTEPGPGVTKKSRFPLYRPSRPTCDANVWAWQYGRDAKECQINTVLIEQHLFKTLG